MPFTTEQFGGFPSGDGVVDVLGGVGVWCVVGEAFVSDDGGVVALVVPSHVGFDVVVVGEHVGVEAEYDGAGGVFGAGVDGVGRSPAVGVGGDESGVGGGDGGQG